MADVRTKRIAGQTNYIVGGHYFNDKAGAHHFAKTGKTLKGQEARGAAKTKALKGGFDSKKRWGNSAMKGHGVNSPAMMEARAKMTDNYTPKHQ